MKILSKAEELVLLSVWRLQPEAYGVNIRKHIIKVTTEDWSIGAVYVPLDRMSKIGYLRTFEGQPTTERGGRRKRYFQITNDGLQALKHAKKVHEIMWADLKDESVVLN